MNKFTKNSSYKIIRITDDESIKLTFETYYPWEKRTFDIINVKDANLILDIILNNNEVDALVFQSNNKEYIDNEIKKVNEFLPNYFGRRTYIYDANDNYGIDLALRINNDQLSKISTPLFSIVTPLYNTNLVNFKYAYESLKNQSLNDWEWVLIDDSPEPLSRLRSFIKKQKDIRLKYYRIGPTNGNIGLSKWRGNCMSTGKWLIEFDHDDMLYGWCLQTLKEAMEKYPNNKFIYSDNTTINGDNQITKCLYGEDYKWGLGYGHSYMSKTPNGYLIRTDSSGPTNNATIRHIVGVPNHLRCWERNFYFSIGGHNITQRIADDYELLVRSFLHTRFTKIPLACYAQRFDGNNSQYANSDEKNESNLNDIQRRVRLIAIYYDEIVHNRLEELGLDDSKRIKGDPYETAKVYEKIHPEKQADDEYIPEWAKE